MPTVLLALPVPPKTTEEMLQKFAQEVHAKMGDFTKSRLECGASQEAWAVQDLPDGGKLFLICLAGDDPAEVNRHFAESNQAFDRWFKDTLGPQLNAEFDQPLPPITRTLMDWRA